MLRWAFWALLLANLVYFAGTQGHLGALGWTPADPREPQRLTQQIEPERLRLLNGPRGSEPPVPVREPATAPAVQPPPVASAAVPLPTETAPPPASGDTREEGARACWQAGGFTDAQAELLRAELRLLGLPDTEWQIIEGRNPGRWIVYMGRYDNAEQVERKKAELRGLGVQFRDISAPGLAPGLALGTYSTEDAARQALQKTERDGVRTAKVAQERAESVSFTLRLPAITDGQRAAVDGLREAMAGKTLRSCS